MLTMYFIRCPVNFEVKYIAHVVFRKRRRWVGPGFKPGNINDVSQGKVFSATQSKALLIWLQRDNERGVSGTGYFGKLRQFPNPLLIL